MVRTILYRVFFSLAIVATLVGQAVAQQSDSNRSIPGDLPSEAPTPGQPSEGQSPGIDHPAPLGAMSRSLNNIDPAFDPAIVPFKGDRPIPGPLSRGSREIETPPGGTVFVPDSILGGDSRAPGDSGAGRAVGTIYQMPNGQLKFVLGGPQGLSSPSRVQDRSFQGGDRGEDTATGTETVDPPVMVGGSYRTPLGFDTRGAADPENHPILDDDSGFTNGEPSGDLIDLPQDKLQMLASNSREFSLENIEVAAYNGGQEEGGPSALQADERGNQYQVSHVRNLTKLRIAFQTKWGDGPWKKGSVLAGKDAHGWHMPTSGTVKLQIRFDCDPGPGANWVTYQLRTMRSPTTVFNKPPTDVFVLLNDGRIDLRKFR